MNVILVGFRCAGKTTVGKQLAQRTGMPFVDCDEHIEQRTGLAISEIFERCGESFFRELESQAIAELCKQQGVVIAMGGGAILRHKNVLNMKRHGKVVYLKIDPETAVLRIRSDPASRRRRPRLSEAPLEEEVRRQMELRESYYRRAADLVVRADEREVEEIVTEIIRQLELEPRGDEEEGRPVWL